MPEKSRKERLDRLLVQKQLAGSRTEAQALILAGQVWSGTQRLDKSGTSYPEDIPLQVRERPPYVGRGGQKLVAAFGAFALSVQDRVCMDIGASTGGFSDCLLQKGALKIYAIDVGYGQLHWKLRNDPRVINLEKTNFRSLDPERIPDPVHFFSIDVSFISVSHIFPRLGLFGAETFEGVCLVKPQFELSPGDTKRGVVVEEDLRQEAVQKVTTLVLEQGFECLGVIPSPLLGAKGNQEYLLWFRKRIKTESGQNQDRIGTCFG